MTNFTISARTLLHLGSELITSDEIALYELIKNSFDAGSSYVDVNFNIGLELHDIDVAKACLDKINVTDSERIADTATYLIECLEERCVDGGEQFVKEVINELQETTDIQQARWLVDQVNTITVSDAGCGMTAQKLRTVFLRIGTGDKLDSMHKQLGVGERPTLGNKGIGRLAMMRLGQAADVVTWTSKDKKATSIYFDWTQFEDPSVNLDSVNFEIEETDIPHESDSGVVITISGLKKNWDIDGIKSDLIEKYIRRLRNPFQNKRQSYPINIHYNGCGRIAYKNKIKDLLWKSGNYHVAMELDVRDIEDDNEQALKLTIKNIQRETDDFIDVRTLRDLCNKLGTTAEEIRTLGPINLNIRWYNRKKLAGLGLGSDLKFARAELNIWCGGIAIYRDGFRVGITGSDEDGDWFELNERALRGGSYIVNSIQTIGAIDISAAQNPSLIDRSNREGLIKNSSSELMIRLIKELVISPFREHIQNEESKGKERKISELAKTGTDKIADKVMVATKNINAIKKKVSPDLKKEVQEISDNLQYINTHVKTYNAAIKMLKEDRDNILQLAAVGTVMNSVMHELVRATSQTMDVMKKLEKSTDETTSAWLSKLQNEIKAINTRIRQFEPHSTSGRQRKTTFDAYAQIQTIVDGYKARLERHNIKVEITVYSSREDKVVNVKMVRGFFIFVIENLMTNSVFWLQDRLMPGEVQRRISIDIDPVSHTISFTDNGPGISPSDRERVFDPGFSLKKGGNGYGLYIVREVAKHHGLNIYLEPSANSDGRLRTFTFEYLEP